MKPGKLPIVVLSLALLGPAALPGCSSHSETTTTTTRETTVAANPDSAPTTTTTTTTTTTQSDEPDSVLGATFHAIGTIILFPFRLVGSAISLLV